ncbi:hypothetical protein [Micromonospora sp. CPCC 206061]|uniref:hypothetical protein n=1 Tax=Micromonospora sp. CPCC 206061 TaxID=3122410 RepID=UPI002FF0D71B
MNEPVAYPPQPGTPWMPPSPATRSRAYRVWAQVLLWAPVALTMIGVALGAGLLAVADADPTYGSAAYGYLGLMAWGILFVLSPVLLGSFIAGLVMVNRARR